MRPGRLDRLLYVGPPDQEGREAVLKIKTKGMQTAPDLNIEEIARLVRGFTFILCVNSSCLRPTAAPARRLRLFAKKRRC